LKIGFIGAGKVGKALGLYWKAYDVQISGYFNKSEVSAQNAAELTKTNFFSSITELVQCSQIIFLTTPDLALEALDEEIAELIQNKLIPDNITWIHVSGALSSDCLKNIKASGSPVGSMHPLQSFGAPEKSAERLENTFFNIEGTDEALTQMRSLLEQAKAAYSILTPQQKPLYHAGACVFSNYLVTLLESGIQFFEAAGIPRDDALRAVRPLIEATLNNVTDNGTVAGLTGPIVRGDYNTISIHIQAIKEQLPSELHFYQMMAGKTMELIAGKRITAEQQNHLIQSLEGTTYGK
jgi:predicted short-subunit dehydrogenase-like oxidoreductase (DUF2520 family)